MPLKILLVSNTAWNVVNFRTGLMLSLREQGYEVIAGAPPDAHVSKIQALGVKYIPILMDNKGTNPIRDFGLFLRFIIIFFKEKPDVYLSYTIKPNVYGTLVAKLFGVKSICNVSGLGTAFIRETFLTRIVEFLYRISVGRAEKVFFQNEDDKELFIKRGIIKHSRIQRIPGSGVNTSYFAPRNKTDFNSNRDTNKIIFLLVARLVKDKGVLEFVEAARIIKKEYPNTEFQLLGFLDVINRTAVLKSEVEEWEKEGLVKYLGSSDDVRPFYENSDCAVLPSYREGLSRTLIEAASMAKPLITTDVPGCRDVVIDGVTGFLCKPQSAEDLAQKMKQIIIMSQEERREMGSKGRDKVLREFDEDIVIDLYSKAIRELIH